MHSYPRLVIAGVRGGSGKTMLSLAVISGLRDQKGQKVVPFKKGPDYIDAGWLSVAAQSPCYNLDPFFLSKEIILRSFVSHARGDVSVIEGNRGLHDGMDAEGAFSTAELAKMLGAPVVLVVDCTKMTRTAAAVVLGCMHLDREVVIRGVVLNQVAGSRHESVVRAAIEKYCDVAVLGAVPKLPADELPERHMGLTPHQEHPSTAKVTKLAGEIAAKYLNMDALTEIAMAVGPIETADISHEPTAVNMPFGQADRGIVKVGVIRDAAFQFYYPENLEELEKSGAEIVDINALSDSSLPDIDALYIGGGFPETNALQLAANTPFRESVRHMAEEGLPIYAECGGLMFLGDSIIVEGKKYPMAGVFPIVFQMKSKPEAHGYTIAEIDRENHFYPKGTVLHGHEFHYSEVVELGEGLLQDSAFSMRRGKGIKDKRDGICYKNVLAAYTHIHALGSPAWTAGLIDCAVKYKKTRNMKGTA
ncbi:MAG: hydrogenobyrinic acid a,c-diamide synthase (glutamine-hydrolyzing) [Nitrospirae bacterium]|nr:hydrogenobyrinic acid a,c-diamide synthase (glutamine-hydrolyzing) [Nitrospirota bacterium]